MNPRVLEQGFDKDKIFGEEGWDWEEEAPSFRKGPLPLPISPLEKEQEGGGLPNRKKK